MIKLYIKEGLQKTEHKNLFITDYAGDIVNLLINKPMVYRIVYDPNYDIYAIGDGYQYLHGWLVRVLKDNGYSDIDVNSTYDAMFVPYTDIDNVEEFDAGFGIGMEYPFQTPIKTGYFLTYRKHDLKNRFTDIFNILNRKHLIISDHKYPKSNERLYPEFGLSNNDLYNNLLINCDNYIAGRVSFIMVDSIEEQIEMLRNLIPVIDRDKMLWRDISLSELDNLEKQLLQRQKELEQK